MPFDLCVGCRKARFPFVSHKTQCPRSPTSKMSPTMSKHHIIYHQAKRHDVTNSTRIDFLDHHVAKPRANARPPRPPLRSLGPHPRHSLRDFLFAHHIFATIYSLNTVFLQHSIHHPRSRTTLQLLPSAHQHISTEDEDKYTRNSTYSCNLSVTPFQSLPPIHFERFYQYIPDLSSEENDAYTDGVNIMYDMLRGPGQLHVQPEQKVIGKFREVRCDDPSSEMMSPLSYIGPKDLSTGRILK